MRAVLTATALLITLSPGHAEDTDTIRTFCNPLPIPNYPIGLLARDCIPGEPTGQNHLWPLGHMDEFRELADPSVLWHEGKWFLYPSVDTAWVSANNGATWQHHPLNIRSIGYAPTVVRHRGKFLLMASGSPLFASDSPLGPFSEIGPIRMDPVEGMPGLADPMLFSDDDGRLYFYWGCTPAGGIWGVELDAEHPTKALTKPRQFVFFDPVGKPWEAAGDWNQDVNQGWLEGSWMVKHRGKYYLTYSAGGTESRTYAMGCYIGSSPLGPFTPQKRNPFFRTSEGLVTGSAHGSIAAGPENCLWVFYTLRVGVTHIFERRLGMDRVEVDDNGELHVPAATSLPQWLPGNAPADPGDSATGWLPINGGCLTIGSTTAPNLQGRFAVDNDLRTWWQPEAQDKLPSITSRFYAAATIHAVRVAWRDVGLDTRSGAKPGPFRFRVELETAKDQWTTILDRSHNTDDLLIDYREVPPVAGSRARLTILGWPDGLVPGVAEFTIFGTTLKSN
jgi:hypothetical protein